MAYDGFSNPRTQLGRNAPVTRHPASEAILHISLPACSRCQTLEYRFRWVVFLAMHATFSGGETFVQSVRDNQFLRRRHVLRLGVAPTTYCHSFEVLIHCKSLWSLRANLLNGGM
jgi:hypothetical protein